MLWRSSLSLNDYYPFGMQMPGRMYNSDDYNYGFNGMEKDDEVKGVGNEYGADYRQYAPRLGRWTSIDPLFTHFPWQSPYVAFDNNPINIVDPKGLSGEKPNIGLLWRNYDMDGQGIIKNKAGNLTQFTGDNTCAIKLSHALNVSGFKIPHPSELPENIRAVTSEDGESYIFGSLDMGRYLDQTLEDPDVHIMEITKDNFAESMELLKGKKGIIQIIAGDPDAYEASGHVDLIGQQGPDTELKGSNWNIENYFKFNLDGKLQVKVWELEETKDNPIPDERGFFEKVYDWFRSESDE